MLSKSFLSPLLIALSFTSYSQTVLVNENFESYTANQSLAQQSSLWETWSGSFGGSDDALVSNAFALSGSNSLLINHDNDMILPIGNYNSGHFTIEFNAYMVEEAYFNVMHTCKSSWAFDLYLTASNEIKYLDQSGISNSIVIDTFSYNEWVNFRFDIDIDNDVVTTYINNIERHQSVFSNAATGSTGSGLTCVNFYGLSGFNGVDHSNYHIDDIVITELNTANLSELLTPEILIVPNPGNGAFEITTEETIKSVTVFNSLGQQLMKMLESDLIDLTRFENGIYQVLIETENGTFRKELVIQR